MKKILTILFVIILLTGCKKEEVVAPQPTPINYSHFLGDYYTTEPFGQSFTMTVTKDSMIFVVEGYSIDEFTSNYLKVTDSADYYMLPGQGYTQVQNIHFDSNYVLNLHFIVYDPQGNVYMDIYNENLQMIRL